MPVAEEPAPGREKPLQRRRLRRAPSPAPSAPGGAAPARIAQRPARGSRRLAPAPACAPRTRQDRAAEVMRTNVNEITSYPSVTEWKGVEGGTDEPAITQGGVTWGCSSLCSCWR